MYVTLLQCHGVVGLENSILGYSWGVWIDTYLGTTINDGVKSIALTIGPIP